MANMDTKIKSVYWYIGCGVSFFGSLIVAYFIHRDRKIDVRRIYMRENVIEMIKKNEAIYPYKFKYLDPYGNLTVESWYSIPLND